MSHSNGADQSFSAVEKQAIATVIKKMVGGLEDRFGKALGQALLHGEQQQKALKDELLKRLEDARREAVMPLQKNYIDTEPMAKELAKQAEDRAAERAIFKDLLEAVTSMPVPMVQSPEHPISIDPTPVTVDMSPVADAISALEAMFQATVDAQVQMTSQILNAVKELTTSQRALAAAVTTLNKPPTEVTIEHSDGTKSTVRRN